MKSLTWRFLFWLLWPLVWFYSPLKTRARVLVICGDEFLVVKPYFGSGLWQLPGGGIKMGETPNTAAARELHEEAGLSIPASELKPLLGVQPYMENGLRKQYIIFLAHIKDKTSDHIKDHEITDLVWLPLSESHQGLAPHVKRAIEASRSTSVSKEQLLK